MVDITNHTCEYTAIRTIPLKRNILNTGGGKSFQHVQNCVSYHLLVEYYISIDVYIVLSSSYPYVQLQDKLLI